MKILKAVFLFLLSAALLCLDQIVSACADGDWGPDYIFFPNSISENNAFRPFYFAPYIQYYDDYEDPQAKSDENIREWLAFMDNSVPSEDATHFIYKFSYKDLKNLYYHIERNEKLDLPDSVRGNGMTKWFLNYKDLEALGYLMFAKQCEAFAVNDNGWELSVKDIAQMSKLVKNGTQLWKAAKLDFFKWRYAYQILRQSFYADEYQNTLDLFEELIGHKKAENIAYYRSLGLKAGALYRLGKYNEAAYLYALVFNGTDDNKKGIYISYDWCFKPHGDDYVNGPRADKQTVLNRAENNEEKALIHLMDALHDPNDRFESIRTVYKLHPEIKGLDVLFTREINKIELGYYMYYLQTGSKTLDPARYSEWEIKRFDENRKKIAPMIALAKQINGEIRNGPNAFWAMAISYLYYLDEDLKQSREWIAKAEKSKPSAATSTILHLEKLLISLAESPEIDAGKEAYLLPSLKWLEEKAASDDRLLTAYQTILGALIYNAYLRQGDTLKAVLVSAKNAVGSGRHYLDPGFFDDLKMLKPEDVIRLKNSINQKKKTAFESWLVADSPFEEGALDLYAGTAYLLVHDFKNAAKMFKKVPSGMLDKYGFEDPFTERWRDVSTDEDATDYNKLTFAQEMIDLQERMKSGSDSVLYRYANGLYNMSYYGVAWHAVKYFKSTADPLAYYNNPERKELAAGDRNYYTAQEAQKYFQLAYDKSKDPEMKAKCLFMLSKCWQKSTPPSDRSYYFDPTENKDYVEYTLRSPYFKKLNGEYKNTSIYSTFWEDCSYLRYYVNKKG